MLIFSWLGFDKATCFKPPSPIAASFLDVYELQRNNTKSERVCEPSIEFFRRSVVPQNYKVAEIKAYLFE